MIKRKLLYLSIITMVLVGPIMYWLNEWWGITVFSDQFFVVSTYAIAHDKVLLITTIVNLILYLIAVVKIITLKDKNRDTKEKIDVKGGENFLGNISQEDIKKWNTLYGAGNSKKNDSEDKNSVEKNVVAKPEPDKKSITVNVNTSVKTEPENVVSMVTVTAKDVYRNMLSDMLIDLGYENIGAKTIGNIDVDFVSIADSDTLLLGIIVADDGNLIANETANSPDDEPSWFANDKRFISPVWQIKNVANKVQNTIGEVLPEDNGIMVKPIVVVPNAVVSNFEDIRSKWEEIGVDVVKFMNHSSLPDIKDVVPNKSETFVLESYKNFVNTLMKYLGKKTKNTSIKKAG